jgi:hypothetical protein
VAAVAFALPGGAPASHAPPGTVLWGYQSAFGSPALGSWDIGTDTFLGSCVPDTGANTNGRGLAEDPASGGFWYSRLDIFTGDGRIHKAGPLPGCAPMGSIPFGDGPGGTTQDDIGAIDVDPTDGNLWVAGYQPVGSDQYLFKVNKTTGAIMQSCHIPAIADGGNDTLAVAQLSGLPGSGLYLLTDAGEFFSTALEVVDTASCTGGGAGTIVHTYTLPTPVTGIDYENGRLIAAQTTFTVFNLISLGGPPFASIVATMPQAPVTSVEDVSLKTNLAPNCSTATATPNLLWPPNHKLTTVTVGGVTDPNGGTVSITIAAVTQDEPVTGLGDGDTSPDAVLGPASNQVQLRAERSGLGDGRVYRITFTATNTAGLTCTGTVTVGVPHDQGQGSTPIDSAPPSYNSLLP